LRLDDDFPDITQDGLMVELTQTGTTGTYTGKLRSVVAGVVTDYMIPTGTIAVQPSWLSVSVSENTISVYWNNALVLTQVVSTHSGTRFGFGLKCVVDGGLALANVFRVQYYSSSPVSSLRSMLIASAFSGLYYESSVCVRDDVQLTAVQDGQQLYIADYGEVAAYGTDGSTVGAELSATSITDWRLIGVDPSDYVAVLSNVTGTTVASTYKISAVNETTLTLASSAGTGNCSYRVERAPKIYDPLTNTLSIWSATVGQVPTGCPLICRYLDRLVLAGAEIAPHVWYMSRQSSPLDWDYVPEALDSQRAVAGTSSPAGVPGEPITALVTHSDDYLILAGRASLWRMLGDPLLSGGLSNLSHNVGIIGPKAWCLVPSGELVFLSLDGLYALSPSSDSYPIPLSRNTLPREFLNINPDIVNASLEYDIQGRGIHIFLTSGSSNSRLHWWMDWDRKTFWPVSLDANHEPTATTAVQATVIEDSGVICGGRDGILRRFSDLSENDCGVEFNSYAVIGPLALAPDSKLGAILSMDAALSESSGDVVWAIQPSLTFEGAASSAVSDTGTWIYGINATNHISARGQACVIKLTGEENRRWAVEQINAIVREAGTRRIP
jgi:hypothetical protein